MKFKQRSYRLMMTISKLSLALCCFLTIHQVVLHYYTTHYSLTPYEVIQQEYLDSITQEIVAKEHKGYDDSLWIDRTKIVGSIYQQLRVVKSDDGHNLANLKPKKLDQLLTWFNLSGLSLDPKNNLNDRILQFHLSQVAQIDQFLLTNYTANRIESELDSRRSQGYRTNLKLCEFRGITHLHHGARLCHPSDYGASLTTVVIVITKPDDFEIRTLIRQTWGSAFRNPNSTTQLYFAFGLLLPTNPKRTLCMKEVKQESDLFEDIIQFDFEEDYFRLTVKSVALLRWVSVYCARVPSIFKVDTDQLVNYDNFVQFTRFVHSNQNMKQEFGAFGLVYEKAKVIRTYKNKYHTSFYDYPDRYYPTYIASAWYLFGQSQPLLKYAASIYQTMPALLWEDLYITGFLGQKLIQSHLPYRLYHLAGFEPLDEIDQLDGCLYRSRIIISQVITPSNLAAIWTQIQQFKPSNENKCELELKIEPVS